MNIPHITEMLRNKLEAERIHPQLAAFFQDFFRHEKTTLFGGRHVFNTHFPPYPSLAFDRMVDQMTTVGDANCRRLYSVTIAITNRCPYDCWHCYNSGRSQYDLPLETWQKLASELRELGVITVTLSGGEPLLRDDLWEIVAAFPADVCLSLNTTGHRLTEERARRLANKGLFALGVSLDSIEPGKHDAMRRRRGAFDAALSGLRIAGDNGLYPYVISVATREFLHPDHFYRFVELADASGAKEIHLLEPCATGNLRGCQDVILTDDEREQLLCYQREAAAREDWPIVSSFASIESGKAFGCGAGLTHLYIDGAGDVSPCNLVPLSFGNIVDEPISQILDEMGCHFCRPRTECIGHVISPYIEDRSLPLQPEESHALCHEHLATEHELPRFFEIQANSKVVDSGDLRDAYNEVHGDYDAYWLSQAATPTDALIERLKPAEDDHVFEAGCGTGYATAQLAGQAAKVIAADISEGMLSQARKRVPGANVYFILGDAMEAMDQGEWDLVFSSWVLGYVPLRPFFDCVARNLRSGGRLAFVVHKDDSPAAPLKIFAEIISRAPEALGKQVEFDFPHSQEDLRQRLCDAGLQVKLLEESAITFSCANGAEALDHLIKSGAGTAFHDAVLPEYREEIMAEFVKRYDRLASQDVVHEYFTCIAAK